MRFTSAAVAVVLLSSKNFGRNDAFSVRPSVVSPVRPTFVVPQKFQRCVTVTSQARNPSLVTLNFAEISGGIEELQELTEKKSTNVVEQQVRKSPSFWKIAGYATIPVSAALGFGLVPSRRLAAHAAGAIVSGVAGAIGKSRLDAYAESAALPAIAQVIIDNGIEDPITTNGYVNEIKDLYGIIDDDDFEAMCAEVYSKYLLGMVKYNPMPKSSEPKELEKLKAALGLNNLLVGEAHAIAALEWYRTTCYYTPEEDLEDPEHPDRQAMDKFLFLTERALKQGEETNEAFKFEMTRVAKAMKLSLTTALDRVSEVQEPFYERALRSTRAKLGSNQVSEAMLERARQTLGIDEETAFDMHVACFNDEVREQLGLKAETDDDDEEAADAPEVDLATAKFKDDSKERLDQLRSILGLSESDANYEIIAEATPLYQSTALSAMKSVLSGVSTPDDAWKKIEARREELLLPESKSKDLLSSIVMQALGGPLEETNKFATVNNEAAVYENLLEALQAKEALIDILAKSGWDEFDNFDQTFCDPWDRQSANGFLRSDERIKLYKIFLNRSVRKAEDGKITDDIFNRILEVKGLLGISDDQAEVEARAAFGPELQKACLKACDEIVQDYTPELAKNMAKQIKDVLDNFRLSEGFLREQGATYYAKAVSQISAKSPAGIPTDDMKIALESLRDMYRLEEKDTYPAHMEYFGAVYKKSILESMGSTGVIRPEFKEALKDLRKRLGVREEDTKELFLEAVEEKFVPMVEWINSEMERTMLSQKQLSERRGKDMGEDVFQTGKSADGTLGLGAEVNIMGDIINLVDFYTENDIAEETEIGTKEVDGEEVPVLETSYPITAIGTGTLDQEMAEYLYRQFVVGAFTAQGAQAARYEDARATFGGILGLTSEKMEDINDNIGSTVYDNFISRSMASKGVLDQQDMMFLANIQTKLGLSSEQGEKLLLQSQKKILSEEINAVMDNPSPQKLKAFREKCNMMGMDLAEDVGISSHRLVRMFEAEIIPALKAGEITVENTDLLSEVQESLNMDPEECETVFENTVLRLAKQAMDLINSELMRGRDENTVEVINELVRYAGFTEGDLDLCVEEATAHKVFNIYEAFDFSGQDKETVEGNKQLLKVALGIAES
ncbi:chloroplast envelope transporter [Nitzschia inconspicua]|uniref:Chloroplast envelope transporter n=1 Tax=Nitzschia inconspicua TaxID=303405 RepID=A0A9K3LSJ2_9STRA|nr:chloroplast envelope transporter [Nitzschia inconspicua]